MSNPPARLTAEAVDEVFPRGVVRPPAGAIPPGIKHRPTREFINGVGLPGEIRGRAAVIHEPADGGWQPLPDLWEEIREHDWTWTMPEHPEDWFYIGNIFGLGLLVIDGESGQVRFIPESEAGLFLLHKSVESLAYYMYAIERDGQKYSEAYAASIDKDPNDPRDKEGVFMEGGRALSAELYAFDPTPFVNDADEPWEDNGEGPWAWMIREISEGAWAE
ncbi:SUKH-4 family immunity protein [Actinomadura sp. WMMB 499]|uniref:SUKH-4 family immunity protein n=1 Tax=Actinomadura sp. WMMB 499 TaxID=1219491 RepID=UPI00159E9010|nr:SUKH-4 family immunity protein [Actinomadura sp. WMMB 499]